MADQRHDVVRVSRADSVPVGRAVAALLARRAAQAVAVAVAVSLACFAVVQALPGDIASRIASGRYGYDQVSAASADAVRAELGLDRPAWVQLLAWLGDLARLDLGTSLVTGAPVTHELAAVLPNTLALAGLSLLLAAVIGTAAGTLAAHRPGGAVDRLVTIAVAGSRAMPPFLLGLLLILVFSVQLGWLPAAGDGRSTSIVLPALTLAVGLSGMIARVARDTVVDVLASDHVRFARTKGLGAATVLRSHVARNSGVTLVAYLGAQAVVLVEGVLVVESLFAWPGLGHALVHAVFWRDIPVLQATALVLALLVVAINTVVDLTTLALDPRPRRERVAA